MSDILNLVFIIFVSCYSASCQNQSFVSDDDFDRAKIEIKEAIHSNKDTSSPYKDWLLKEIDALPYIRYKSLASLGLQQGKSADSIISWTFIEIYSFHALVHKLYCIEETNTDEFLVSKLNYKANNLTHLGVISKDYFSRFVRKVFPPNSDRIGEDYMLQIKFHPSGNSQISMATNIDFTIIDQLNMVEEMLFDP